MDFYESISAHYDLIFPVDPGTVDFISGRTKPRSRILDIACGTGGHSLALAEKGHRLTGIDLDRDMIEAARAKAQGLDLHTVFQVMDMLAMVEQLDPGFDLAFCIGNSLVHLESEEKIQRVLMDCHRLLNPGAMLILQIINYDQGHYQPAYAAGRIRRAGVCPHLRAGSGQQHCDLPNRASHR
jgi:2-polyprenyl-3-methyl-5-hydroxy-6-metoxy-1,4-benzoquinol methylase